MTTWGRADPPVEGFRGPTSPSGATPAVRVRSPSQAMPETWPGENPSGRPQRLTELWPCKARAKCEPACPADASLVLPPNPSLSCLPAVAYTKNPLDPRGAVIRDVRGDLYPGHVVARAIRNLRCADHSWRASSSGVRPRDGDFRRLHRMGLIACYYLAAEWEHTEVMRAAHNLLLYLDKSRA
jgi:hypothetical protein